MDFKRRSGGRNPRTGDDQILQRATEIQLTFGMKDGGVDYVEFKIQGMIGWREAVAELSNGNIAQADKPDAMEFARQLMEAIDRPRPSGQWPAAEG